MRSICVFGATGNLGCYTTLALKKAGYTVYAIGRKNTSNVIDFFNDNGITYIGGVDLADRNTFANIELKKVDAVVNMAGAMPASSGVSSMPYVQSIIAGTVNLCEWMEMVRCKRVVFNTTPSDISYLFGTKKPADENALPSFPKNGKDHSVYAICKNAAVDIIKHYSILNGLTYSVFRHLTVYAFHPSASYILDGVEKILPWRLILRNCIAGKPIEIWGDKDNLKELLYIDDFTDAVIASIETTASGVFNLPGYKPYTLEEQIKSLINIFSPAPETHTIIYCPDKSSTPENLLKLGGAKDLLKWEPKVHWEEACLRIKNEIKENRFEKIWGSVDAADESV